MWYFFTTVIPTKEGALSCSRSTAWQSSLLRRDDTNTERRFAVGMIQNGGSRSVWTNARKLSLQCSKLSRCIFLLMLLTLHIQASAQIGSNASFQFLNLNTSARNTALGGTQASMSLDSGSRKDASLWMLNPAYSHPTLTENVALSYMPYYADVHFTTLSYTHAFEKWGTWAAGIQYLNYGSMEGFDIAGIPQGTFSAQDYAVVINHSQQIGVYRIGGNIKYVTSKIGGYGASAMLLDIGGAFVHPEQDLTVSLLFSNFGFLLQDYTGASNSRLPSDIRISVAFKPEHMPFRFHITGYKFLTDTKAYYQADNEQSPGLLSKSLRHLVFGGEILLSPNFNVRVGYNHLIKSTLQLQQVSGGAGLTFGFMLRIKSLQIDFSREYYHVVGGFSHLTLTADLKQLIFRK